MSKNAKIFDDWIRHEFVEINTQLELLYWKQADKTNVTGIGDSLKSTLLRAGNRLIKPLLNEGNTNQGFDSAFDLLGNVGLFMAACRRHEITEPSRETRSPLIDASALAMHIGASIGVTPRFATAHLTTHNRAINGEIKRFTNLASERLFVDYNTKGILGYKRAATALNRISPLGISNSIVADLLTEAAAALDYVLTSNKALYEQLDATSFFYQVRPYYKPHRVGLQVYRGANAGDFAGINVIDLLLGLCFANDPEYSQLLVDKFLYMMPEDQALLRDTMRQTSLMDQFLQAKSHHDQRWYQQHLALFLDVCKRHGETAIQHHDQLVKKYIALPAEQAKLVENDKLTASGPPLPVLLNALERLRDRRAAVKRDDIRTRYHDINDLKNLLVKSAKL